jgi:SAM-dependent methyltransferase
MSQQVWDIVERGSRATDSASKEKINEIYSEVASLYHDFRPKYPEHLIEQAIQSSPLLNKEPSKCNILEVGCGPGTLTLPLLKRGFNVTAIDPGSGMIGKCREVCGEYENMNIHQVSLKEFESDAPFDAIFAGSSLHWALAENDRAAMIAKLHSLLKDSGTLVLLWNFPPEPKDDVLDEIADAIGETKPFYLSNGSVQDHEKQLAEKVLTPLHESNLFEPFETFGNQLSEDLLIPNFISFLKTLSNYIVMETEEATKFFNVVEQTLIERHGNTIPTSRKSVLNVLSRNNLQL